MRAGPRKIRVLNAVGVMDIGGAEMLLMSILRSPLSRGVLFDFVVRERKPGAFDEEVAALGGTVICCPHDKGALAYARGLWRILRNHGPYDVFHSHMHFFDGLALAVAALAGVPIRISHSHAAGDAKPSTPTRWLQRTVLRSSIRASATHRLGVSEASYRALFGSACVHSPNSRILRNGIDIPADRTSRREAVRAELGIPSGSTLVGHVGRFDEHKNQSFLLSCFHELRKRDQNARLLFIGDGDLRGDVLRRAAELGLSGAVTDVGVRSDVHRLLDALDLFIFPSVAEGFGLALVEAQAHGLPCLASAAVPREADIGLGLVSFMDLAAGPAAWASRALELGAAKRSSRDYWGALADSGYDMREIIPFWLSLYDPQRFEGCSA